MNTADHGGENPDDLLAEAIVEDAVRRRRAQGWGRRRALDDVEVAATLVENVGTQVALSVASGQELQGIVTFVGDEVVHLEAVDATHWVRSGEVVAVAPASGRLAGLPDDTADDTAADEPAADDTAPDDSRRGDVPLVSLLADLVDDERSVELHLRGGVACFGVVEAVGRAIVLTDPTGTRSVVEPDAVVSVTLPS